LLFDILRTVVGLAVLIYAADRLVRSAIRISRAFGVSAVLIGAVVVGFGTSLPEFVVSALAAIEGRLELAISNVVASNTSNVTLVLGAAAVAASLAARRRIVRREGALMFAAVIALTATLADGHLGIVEGFILTALLFGAIYLMVRWSKEAPELPDDPGDDDAFERLDPAEADDGDTAKRELARWRRIVGREIVIGLVALGVTLIAADFLLDGVVGIGVRLGLPTLVLGLITGVGTSLPELAAGLAGARQGHSDLVIGNVVGSNIFNSLGVAGLAAILGPGSVAGITTATLAIMVAAAFIAGVFAFTGRTISRTEGLALLAGFGLFVLFTFL
jgi:cation:H+ antiporter